MNELSVIKAQLPDNIEDLSAYVFVGREKLTALKAAIKACKRTELISEKLNQMKEEEMLLAENVLIAEMRIGELSLEMEKSKGGRGKTTDSGVRGLSQKLNVNERTIYRNQVLAKHPEAVEEAIQNAKTAGRPVRRTDVNNLLPSKPKETEKTLTRKAMQEHRELQEQKAQGIVEFKLAVKDRENIEQIVEGIKHEISATLRIVSRLGRLNSKDAKEAFHYMPKDTKTDLIERIGSAIDILNYLREELIHGK